MPFQRPTRRQFLAGLGAGGVTAISGCASSSSTPATAALDWPSDEWPVAHGTPTNTGYTRSKSAPRTDPTMEEWQLWDMEEWQVSEDSVRYRTTSSPVVANGTLFVATGLPGGHSADENGVVLALDAARGKIQWSATLPKGGSGTPAVADGLVIVGSNDRALTAFDTASGSVRWRTTTSAPVGTPAVAGDHVYVGDGHGSVHAFRRTDGKLRWRYGQRTLDSLGSFLSDKTWEIRAKPAVTDDTVYVTTGIGQHGKSVIDRTNLLALSRDDGSERWRYEYARDGYTYRPPRAPVVADGTVFVSDSALHAVDSSDGSKQWQFTFGYRRSVSAPAVHDGTVYIGAKNVYALSAEDGTEQWRFVNRAPISSMGSHRAPMVSAPAVTDETVYIGAGALDSSSGEKLWGDLGNQEDSEYFASHIDQNATLEGPAIAGETVFMATEYGSVIRATEGSE
ncbi:Pyrrolo-quinoline quinone [Haladaptatus sp. R4]|uniref:outer membrane protein assembly factor BamB family protein n=1 Tax=Haladaptatus sp. R4 TaxID=1679489 RepID=UPI0007B48954|nr:PQQ-binding-like beta-propeller repeat protein [Haladaptatus sp. R4]KZN22905.1 Pyrrolo-quinoline quinone [Haladaptatus sp. R4]